LNNNLRYDIIYKQVFYNITVMIKRKVNVNGKDIEFEIFSPDEECNGKTYGQCLADSWNVLLSADPDQSDGPICFLRTSPNPREAPYRKRLAIFSDQAVFIPIVSTAVNTDDSPDLNTEEKRRASANKDTDEGDNPPKPEQVTIDDKPIVDDLKEFRVESPEFELNVDNRSPVKDKLDIPARPGTLPTVAVGYCVIIKSLPPRDQPYTIHIKAKGHDAYRTEAVYELQVSDR
jgi:hypothetical protein